MPAPGERWGTFSGILAGRGLTVTTEQLYHYEKSETCMSLLLMRIDMTLRKKTRKYDNNTAQKLTLLAGEECPRGVEKPGGFFSLPGAPSDPLAAEKPGGFFSGPSSGGSEREFALACASG